MRTTSFIYHNKKYKFDLDHFKSDCNCIPDEFIEESDDGELIFNLIEEFESGTNLSEASIIKYLNYFENHEIELTNDDVIPIQHLSKKYQNIELSRTIEQYIQLHYDELIDLYFETGEKYNSQEIENLISYHMSEYINDDRLFSLSIPTIHRILKQYCINNQHKKYFSTSKEEEEPLNRLEKQIIDFIFKIVKKRGIEASILFTSIEIGDKGLEYFVDKLQYNYNFIDFNMIKSKIIDHFYLREKKQKKKEKELMTEILNIKKEIKNMKREYEKENEKQNQKMSIDSSTLFVLSRMMNFRRYPDNVFELLNFLSKANLRSNKNIDLFECLFIPGETNNLHETILQYIETNNKIKKIGIRSKILEMLISSGSLKSLEFIEIISSFQEITFDIPQKLINKKNIPTIINSVNYIKKNMMKSYTNIYLQISIDSNDIEVFSKYTKLINIVHFNQTLTTINNSIFEGYSSLISINIPACVRSIGSKSFSGCCSLKEITIPASVCDVGELAFENCSNLTKITINPYQTKINENAFKNCSSLNHLCLDPSIKTIKRYEFNNIGKFEFITIPPNTTLIDEFSFSGITSLKEISIPNTVQTIGKSSFSGCSSLNSVIFGTSITKIEDRVFEGCSSLSKIIIPTSVTSIGDEAFSGCKSLLHIFIPITVIHIGEKAFENCPSLSLISIPMKTIEIQSEAKILVNEGDYDSFCQYMNDLKQIILRENKMDETLEYLRISSDIGNDESMLFYGYLMQCNSNINESAKYYKKAADIGNSNAMYCYAFIKEKHSYYYGNKEIVQYYKMSAEKGNSTAMNKYAYMLKYGKGVAVNKIEAAQYYKMSADKGNCDSMYNYAYMLRYDEDIAIDKEEAIRYFKMSADKGNDSAMTSYAYMLEYGEGTEINLEEAIKYYKMAIEKGNDTAMNNYAYILEYGKGTEINKEEAIKYYKMAIEKGNNTSMNNYAYMLEHGEGTEINIEEAIKYYKMSIKKGNTYAMNNYAHMLRYNERIEINKSEAAKYYKMSADKGNTSFLSVSIPSPFLSIYA